MKITCLTAITALCAAFLVSCNNTPQLETEDRPVATPQIVGGVTATANEFPFMVRLGNSPSQQWCGASLIAANWVLTAAHCLNGERASGVYATAGDHRINTNEGSEQSRQGSRIIIHPNYVASTYDNDIALLKVTSSFTLNSKVATIGIGGLPSSSSQLTVIGWGTTREGGSSANTLRKVNVTLQSSSSCSSAYPGDITSSMFCAGESNGGKDSCQGDSGGPIFASGRQVGIVSWGNGCARARQYGVYTNANNFANWIQTTIANN
jgi:secreted trypsin-like serine protease